MPGDPTETTNIEPARVVKIVKLGEQTLLVADLGDHAKIAEGEYTLESITVVPLLDAPSGATVIVGGGCVVKSCSLRMEG